MSTTKGKSDMTGRQKVLGALQKFGPTIMPVIALIPLAGLLLGLGTLLANAKFIEMMPVLGSSGVAMVASLFKQIGNLVIGNLPILFAVAIASGLCAYDAYAAFGGMLTYLSLIASLGRYLRLDADVLAANGAKYTTVLGIQTMQIGVFGGIAAGLTAAWIWHKVKDVEFPQAMSFFQGKRFVAIACVIGGAVLAIPMLVIWPVFQAVVGTFANYIVNSGGYLTYYLNQLITRLLVPFGLHPILNTAVAYQFGEYTTLAGDVVHGTTAIFLNQLADGVPMTVHGFKAACYFYIPANIAMALAISREAKPENRKKILGMYTAGIVTVFATGITEPVEFTYLFTCPGLYVIYALCVSLSGPLMAFFDIQVGTTFCGGLMDWLIYGVFQNAKNWWLLIPVDIVGGVILYYFFRFCIRKFNFKTPGREDLIEIKEEYKKADALAAAIVKALGGKNNIKTIEACATRLRVSLQDVDGLDKDTFKTMGASGVFVNGNNWQIVFGTKAAMIKEQVRDILDGRVQIEDSAECACCQVAAVAAGKIMELKEVSDPVFAEGSMGAGYAVEPEEKTVVSPVKGKISTVFPTKHAIGITDEQGNEVLIHLGLDTVQMEGKPFKIFVEEGDMVDVGQKIAAMDIDMIRNEGYCATALVLFTNLQGAAVTLKKNGTVKAGEKDIIQF